MAVTSDDVSEPVAEPEAGGAPPVMAPVRVVSPPGDDPEACVSLPGVVANDVVSASRAPAETVVGPQLPAVADEPVPPAPDTVVEAAKT